MNPKRQTNKKTKKTGLRSMTVKNKAPKKKVPTIGNTSSGGMWGF